MVLLSSYSAKAQTYTKASSTSSHKYCTRASPDLDLNSSTPPRFLASGKCRHPRKTSLKPCYYPYGKTKLPTNKSSNRDKPEGSSASTHTQTTMTTSAYKLDEAHSLIGRKAGILEKEKMPIVSQVTYSTLTPICSTGFSLTSHTSAGMSGSQNQSSPHTSTQSSDKTLHRSKVIIQV